MKYAFHASDAFNERFAEMLGRFTEEVRRVLGNNLVALLLGGGYGRGEGGVVTVDDVERPYNDLDFVLVVNTKSAVNWTALDQVSHRYEEELNVHVDFSRPLTRSDIQQWPHWLMWHDLINGYVVLEGEAGILEKNAPKFIQQSVPLIEASRLLLNRGAGLLWGMRVSRGVEEAPDGDFVRRNYYKCMLALGDALLIAYDKYTTAYQGRDKLVETLLETTPDLPAINLQEQYRRALRYKFSPDEFPEAPDAEAQGTMAIDWGAIFLHVEERRTGKHWQSLEEYTRWSGLRESEQHTPKKLLRNLVRNAQIGRCSWKYAREHLFRKLPQLLGLTNTRPSDWAKDSANFIYLWERFN